MVVVNLVGGGDSAKPAPGWSDGQGKCRWEGSSEPQGRTRFDSWQWRGDSSTVLVKMPIAASLLSPPSTMLCLWCSLLHPFPVI